MPLSPDGRGPRGSRRSRDRPEMWALGGRVYLHGPVLPKSRSRPVRVSGSRTGGPDLIFGADKDG